MSTADIIALFTCVATGLTCFATFVYVIFVAYTLLLLREQLSHIREQLDEQIKERKLQETITIFNRLQASELISARRYIYESLPRNVEGVERSQIVAHIQKAETAFFAFDHIGYLLDKGHVDKEPIMEMY